MKLHPDSARPLAYSVVIPFFNEAPNVARLLEEVRCAMDALGGEYEVLCVDDGSTDTTGAELGRIEEVWARCRVIELAGNQGQAAALLAGLGTARGEVLITMDGDGQNDPADIPRLLARLKGCDMVAGVRARREDSPLRRVMSRLANGVRSRFLRDGVSDTGCALKAFRREVAGAFLPIRTLYSFMPALTVAAGFRVAEHPVNHRPRTAGASKYGLRAMLWRPLLDMLGVWWFIQRRVRIHRAKPQDYGVKQWPSLATRNPQLDTPEGAIFPTAAPLHR
ncbi:MAG TPA: glycosyltransferase family 2 protein [Chthoniobacteraceae bacterium]|jgi:dolichol-phosphate mannosyltransferase|nr:glycosyltransferase family 2 protein [Chthoniobacteraceae bacterium]